MNLMNFGVMPVKIRVSVWVHKEKNGIIYSGSYESDTDNYKVCDNAGHISVRGAVQTIEDMIKNILEQAKCTKATWLKGEGIPA